MYKYIFILTFMMVNIYANNDFDIDILRQNQKIELEKNLKIFQEKAKRSIEYGNYDAKQKKKLLNKYSWARTQIIVKYKRLDKYRTIELKRDLATNGGITNTGSYPKNANADVDIVANNKKAFEKQKERWIKKYGEKNIEFNSKESYKITNNKTDTVMWKSYDSLTSSERRAITKDHDAYITSGGKHSTSVRSVDIKSSKTGSGLDPLRKLTYGIKHDIIKDVGKSLVKITTSADGVDFINSKTKDKEAKLLQQASALKEYKDSIEAGIVDLLDTPSMAKQKENKFKKECLNLAIKKQNKLDIADQKKKRIYKHMISTFPEGSSKRNELEKKLKISEKSNTIARKKVNSSLKELGVKKQLLTKKVIEKTEQKIFEKKENSRAEKREKLLQQAQNRRETFESSKPKKKVHISKLGAASFLVTAYQLNESMNDTIAAGGNDFVTINKNDSQLTKNIKAYVGIGVESTTFGGAFSAGKRADEEEKQRIIAAIKQGKSVNPLVSFVRASFWGFAYVAKDMAVGSFEYTKNKLLELDNEIKSNIKSYVREKYAVIEAKKQEKRVSTHKKEKISKNEKWDNFLLKNKKELQSGQSQLVASLDKKIKIEEKKAKKIKVATDEFSDSFTSGENSITEYKEKVQNIAQMEKDIERIKRETAETQERIDHQWDGFKEGLAVVSTALVESAKEYQNQQSEIYKSQRNEVLEDDSDDDYDREWNEKVVEAFSKKEKLVEDQKSSTSHGHESNSQVAVNDGDDGTYEVQVIASNAVNSEHAVSKYSYSATSSRESSEDIELNLCGRKYYIWADLEKFPKTKKGLLDMHNEEYYAMKKEGYYYMINHGYPFYDLFKAIDSRTKALMCKTKN